LVSGGYQSDEFLDGHGAQGKAIEGDLPVKRVRSWSGSSLLAEIMRFGGYGLNIRIVVEHRPNCTGVISILHSSLFANKLNISKNFVNKSQNGNSVFAPEVPGHPCSERLPPSPPRPIAKCQPPMAQSHYSMSAEVRPLAPPGPQSSQFAESLRAQISE
jgi:hypothetical protein